MALFKPFDGTADDLDQVPVNNGFVYFVTDEQKLYADVDGRRYGVSGLKIHNITINPNNWTASGDNFMYNWVEEEIKCGDGGITPPIIQCVQNIEEYSKIDSAVSTRGAGIVFTASEKPTAAIKLTIMDFQ